jgi:hypothetical protein
MTKLLKKAADFLRDVHDGVEKPPKRRRPRGLCHCQHCHILRHEGID